MTTPDRNVILYGTVQGAAAPRVLRAGRLSCELDAGNLRHVRVDGVEAIRAVSFIVRDRDWGTYDPVIDELEVHESADGFTVGYRAVATEGARRFEYRARIVGTPSALSFEGEGSAPDGFETNRTGFVVLHPIAGVAGEPVRIERVDGSVEQGRFPTAVDPVQPMMALRALTHEALPGVSVECRMEGDTYEMEDQRNWTDASYKTYVRPLALPWPYEIAPGERIEQRVVLTVSGDGAGHRAAEASPAIELGDAAGAMPAIGVALTARLDDAGKVAALAALGLDTVLCHHDPRRGDGDAWLAEAHALARRFGATPALEAVIGSVDGFEAEVAALGNAAGTLDPPFAAVRVSPAADTRGTLPGSPWPPAPPLDALYASAREAFPDARIVGGTYAFFTELNRKRPPTEPLDAVCFTTSALVHAGDDATAMENLEAVPAVVATAREIASRVPLSIGPSAIGMRLNPYGDAPAENPDNLRQAMNRVDPRQRGLFGAAWLVGYAAAASADGVESLILGEATGARGLVHVAGDGVAPWYDGHGGLYPQYHVVRTLAGWSSRPRIQVRSNRPADLAAIACDVDGRRELLLANLTAEPLSVGLASSPVRRCTLDADSFVTAASDTAFFDGQDARDDGAHVALDAYAVARLVWN